MTRPGFAARRADRRMHLIDAKPRPLDVLAIACMGAECPACPRRKYLHDAEAGRAGKLYRAGGLMVLGMVDQWSGKPGRLFEALLRGANIDPETVYYAEPMACPDGDVVTEQEIAAGIYACLGRLEYEISEARPGVIVTLGNEALHALTGYTRERMVTERFECSLCGDGPRAKKCPECGGRKTRGSVAKEYVTDHRVSWVAGATFAPQEASAWLADYGVRYVVSTFTPSALLVKAETVSQSNVGGQFIANTFVSHLAKAQRLLTRDRDWALEVTVTDLVEDVTAYTADTSLPYAVDIETDAKNPYDVTTIKCIGIGRADRAEVLVVDTSAAQPGDPLVRAVAAFLEDRTKKKVFQNRQYDELVCELRWGVVTEGTIFDTMLAHHAISPDEPHNLQRIALTYSDAPAWKPPRNRNGMEAFANDEEFWTYNARDVRATALAHRAMATTLRAEMVAQVHEHDLRMATIAMEMQRVGIPLDEAGRAAIGVEYRQQAEEALAGMREYLRAWRVPSDEPGNTSEHHDPALFNPDSPKQLGWALFEKGGPCGLRPTLLSEKTGEPSTSRDAVRPYASHAFVAMLLRYRDAKKIVGTYIDSEGLRLGPDGRIHPSWNVHGTVTGRWSSSPNLQNWPAIMRTIVKPAPGFVLIGADYSQLELRIIAALAGDPTLIRLCMEADESDKTNPQKDPHSYVAALAFGKVFLDSDGKGRKALRDGTKSVVYGMNYGAGARKIQQTVMSNEDYKGPPLTIDMVERIMGAYFQGFPQVKAYRDRALERAAAQRGVFSPLLRRRRPFPLGDVDATIAMNFPIQSCAADIMNESLDVLYKALPGVDPDAVIIAQVHDAVYVEAREEHAAAVAALIEQSLTRTLRLVADAPEMLFVASAKIGTSWDKVS